MADSSVLRPQGPPARRRRYVYFLAALALLLAAALLSHIASPRLLRQQIGATADVTEVSTGLVLPARVDTGAEICSIHYDAVEIDGGSEDSKANIGRPIRFLIRDPQGREYWIGAKIVDHTHIRTPDSAEERLLVYLTLRAEGVEKTVLTSLNNRAKMEHPVLLGRNFLRHDFLVNVDRDSDDLE